MVEIKLLSYPTEDFLKQGFLEGKESGIVDDLCVFWHSPIEIIIDGIEIFKSVIDEKHTSGNGLAIPVNDFWNTWTSLLRNVKTQQVVVVPFLVSSSVKDTLAIKLVNDEGGVSLEVIDTEDGKSLSSAKTEYATLIKATNKCKTEAVTRLMILLKDYKVEIDDNKIDFSVLFPEVVL